MPHDRMESILLQDLKRLATEGRRKGKETVVTRVLPASGARGPRFLVEGEGEKPFLRMNSNGYLGLSLRPEIIAAEHDAVEHFGTGPGAVRFISGTWGPHLELERALARFHGREAAMLFSSAYATVMGVLPPLITADTAIVSDELNHNCIINAIRLARPRERYVYRHLDLAELEAHLKEAAGSCKRAIIVTDGIFSMRGDHAPLAEIDAIARKHDAAFPENVLVAVDDSHGVGAFGATGRGTEERTGAKADILIGTLGKAFGVNGGYVVASSTVTDYLRETASLYIYSNPISPGEAVAAAKAVALVDSPVGRELLKHLIETARRFRDGLTRLGCETIAGDHPIVPLLLRDTPRTAALVQYLREHGVLATGLAFPVVPRGSEEIRFQICADHTTADIVDVLQILREFRQQG
jgi:glycine C-acetyltransferase